MGEMTINQGLEVNDWESLSLGGRGELPSTHRYRWAGASTAKTPFPSKKLCFPKLSKERKIQVPTGKATEHASRMNWEGRVEAYDNNNRGGQPTVQVPGHQQQVNNHRLTITTTWKIQDEAD